MRRFLLAAGLVAIALPLAAPKSADAASCRSRKQTGTVVGAAGGALLGNAISHGAGGLIVGGLGGAVVGHEIGKGGCDTRQTTRSNYRRTERAPAPQPARRVYYDQYGKPVAADHR